MIIPIEIASISAMILYTTLSLCRTLTLRTCEI
jgi:hypothetical protein